MTSSKKSAADAEPEGLLVGYIGGAFGLRGESKLHPTTDFPDRLASLDTLRLRMPDGQEERRAVVATRPHKSILLVRFKGCSRIEDAEALRGAEVWIDEEQAAPLPEGTFYVHEILGIRMVTDDGEELGSVDEVIRTASNDVYRAGRLLVPATRDAIVRLDPAEGVIVTRSRAYLEGEEA